MLKGIHRESCCSTPMNGRTDRQIDRYTDRQTDKQTDVKKLIIAFRNFATAPNKKYEKSWILSLFIPHWFNRKIWFAYQNAKRCCNTLIITNWCLLSTYSKLEDFKCNTVRKKRIYNMKGSIPSALISSNIPLITPTKCTIFIIYTHFTVFLLHVSVLHSPSSGRTCVPCI